MELVSQEQMAKIVRKKRKSLDIEQQQLAQLTDMSPSQVNRIENNNVNPSYQSVYKLWKKLEELEKEDNRTAKELMNTPVTWIKTGDTLEEATEIMKKNSFSQLPVKNEDGDHTGRITESRIMETGEPDTKVDEVMETPFMEVKESTSENAVREILKDESAVLVKKNGGAQGIITKTDLI